MKFIINFVTKFIKKITIKDQPKRLGRWNLEYCEIKTNQKIDLSNEDHCGPCGHYRISKLLGQDFNEDKLKR